MAFCSSSNSRDRLIQSDCEFIAPTAMAAPPPNLPLPPAPSGDWSTLEPITIRSMHTFSAPNNAQAFGRSSWASPTTMTDPLPRSRGGHSTGGGGWRRDALAPHPHHRHQPLAIRAFHQPSLDTVTGAPALHPAGGSTPRHHQRRKSKSGSGKGRFLHKIWKKMVLIFGHEEDSSPALEVAEPPLGQHRTPTYSGRVYTSKQQHRSRPASHRNMGAKFSYNIVADGQLYADPADAVREFIRNNDVVIFSKSYCPYCTKVKKLLNNESNKHGIPQNNLGIMELDKLPQGDAIQDTLEAITGQRTVPRVFVCGKSVGGCDDTYRLHRSGQLSKLMAKCFNRHKE